MEEEGAEVNDETKLREYQQEAIDAFLKAGKGTLKMHSGSGKTVTAAAIIEALTERKSNEIGSPVPFYTTFIVPTIDLVEQTKKVMAREGIQNVVVMTYAKASRLQESEVWDIVDLIIFDEAHHLGKDGGAWQRLLINAYKAPYALGLTATPPTDPENVMLRVLPILYERTLGEGTDEGFAAPVEVRPIAVKLSDDEREKYAELTEKIRILISRHGVDYYQSRVYEIDQEGRKIYGGMLTTERKQLVAHAAQKFVVLRELVEKILHLNSLLPSDELGPAPTRVLVWTEYVDVLEKAKAELNRNGPIAELITGKTKKKERARLWAEWGTTYPVLLTARVADEGIDVPECEIGIIIAGARTRRQNMQRIGRLLRPLPGKVAKLWVVFAENTFEEKLLNMIDAVTE